MKTPTRSKSIKATTKLSSSPPRGSSSSSLHLSLQTTKTVVSVPSMSTFRVKASTATGVSKPASTRNASKKREEANKVPFRPSSSHTILAKAMFQEEQLVAVVKINSTKKPAITTAPTVAEREERLGSSMRPSEQLFIGARRSHP